MNGEDDLPDDLLRQLLSASGGAKKMKLRPLTESELKLMKPIDDLKPFDKVKWKDGLSYAKFPEQNEVCLVSRIIHPLSGDMTFSEIGSAVTHDDFCIAFYNEGSNTAVLEYAYDSRYFDRVE